MSAPFLFIENGNSITEISQKLQRVKCYFKSIFLNLFKAEDFIKIVPGDPAMKVLVQVLPGIGGDNAWSCLPVAF